MNETWQQITQILENELNPNQFTLWIKPLHASLNNNVLELAAPNEFVAAWVRDKLTTHISQAASQVLGSPSTVTVRSTPKPTPTVPETAAKPSSAESTVTVKAKHLGLPLTTPLQSSQCCNWRHSFDDFVVGPSNDLAYAAAQGVVRNDFSPGPLFISSSAGLGKTHLIQAIGHAAQDRTRSKNLTLRYLTAEEFATKMLMALNAKDMNRFKTQFREGIDILLLEDIHFLQGKAMFQDELLSTIKALQERGSRVVFTSSFLPKELSNVDTHLVSRFCSGFLTVIDTPDFDMRRRIVRHKSRQLQVNVPDDVAELLAESITSDIRQLESCLQNLILKAKLLNEHISLDMARDVLGNYASQNSGMALERIVEMVCRTFILSPTQLASKSRKRHIVLARNTAFFLARKHTQLSLKDIADRFNRTHSTVIKGITSLEVEMSKKTPTGRQIQRTLEQMDL
jgi:chromosomal replication initiator protein